MAISRIKNHNCGIVSRGGQRSAAFTRLFVPFTRRPDLTLREIYKEKGVRDKSRKEAKAQSGKDFLDFTTTRFTLRETLYLQMFSIYRRK